MTQTSNQLNLSFKIHTWIKVSHLIEITPFRPGDLFIHFKRLWDIRASPPKSLGKLPRTSLMFMAKKINNHFWTLKNRNPLLIISLIPVEMNYLPMEKFQLAKIFVEKLLQYELKYKVIKCLATSKYRSWLVWLNQELTKGYNGAICHGLANWGYSDSLSYYYRAMTLLRREGALGSCCSVTKT